MINLVERVKVPLQNGPEIRDIRVFVRESFQSNYTDWAPVSFHNVGFIAFLHSPEYL